MLCWWREGFSEEIVSRCTGVCREKGRSFDRNPTAYEVWSDTHGRRNSTGCLVVKEEGIVKT